VDTAGVRQSVVIEEAGGHPIVSQLPPTLVDAVAEKRKADPVPVTVRVCGSGLEPPAGIVKYSGATFVNWEVCAAAEPANSKTAIPMARTLAAKSDEFFISGLLKSTSLPRLG
jgi:hypothetical protein